MWSLLQAINHDSLFTRSQNNTSAAEEKGSKVITVFKIYQKQNAFPFRYVQARKQEHRRKWTQ